MKKRRFLQWFLLVAAVLMLVCVLSVGALVSDDAVSGESETDAASEQTVPHVSENQEQPPEPITEGDYRYLCTEQGAVIVDYLGETSLESVLCIPAELGGLPVVGIGGSAFENNAEEGYNGLMGTVVLPETLLFIADRAFYDSHYVLGVAFPASLTSIGESAFYGCCNLENVVLPEQLQSIGDYAFAWCDCFSEIVIPAGVTEMGENVFEGCVQLSDISYAE